MWYWSLNELYLDKLLKQESQTFLICVQQNAMGKIHYGISHGMDWRAFHSLKVFYGHLNWKRIGSSYWICVVSNSFQTFANVQKDRNAIFLEIHNTKMTFSLALYLPCGTGSNWKELFWILLVQWLLAWLLTGEDLLRPIVYILLVSCEYHDQRKCIFFSPLFCLKFRHICQSLDQIESRLKHTTPFAPEWVGTSTNQDPESFLTKRSVTEKCIMH